MECKGAFLPYKNILANRDRDSNLEVALFLAETTSLKIRIKTIKTSNGEQGYSAKKQRAQVHESRYL